MFFTFDSFIYRAIPSTLFDTSVVNMTIYAAFESFYYGVAIFIPYIVCSVVKLAFNYTCSWFVTFYFCKKLFSCFYILNMPVAIKTWRAVMGLFVNTTQQFAVFHLTKFRGSTLYRMLLFFLILIVFKEFSNKRDLILGTFFCLWPNDFFFETKLAIKNRYNHCVSLYTFFFISLEIYFDFKSYSYFVKMLK